MGPRRRSSPRRIINVPNSTLPVDLADWPIFQFETLPRCVAATSVIKPARVLSFLGVASNLTCDSNVAFELFDSRHNRYSSYLNDAAILSDLALGVILRRRLVAQ